MRRGKVDIPQDLIDAQREGNLAIFAGAGVSAGPPSCLPGFEGLITEIEEWSGESRREKTYKDGGEDEGESKVVTRIESFENYLGRLEDKGVKFREKVREELGRDDSEPTDLHRHLLRLFPSPEDVRLITTNFDPHFSTAAKDVFDDPVAEYRAPALPLGDDFTGIVYLHGNLRQEERRWVLSDSDFSRAYLTEGWARRFLQGLFSRYVVLFVGYGHGDDVMRYLARGISPDVDQGRYAFEKDWGETTDWSYFGIEARRYPKAEDDNPHAELPHAIDEWREYAMGLPSEHEARIQKLVEDGPEGLDSQEAYLMDVLSRTDRLQFFTRHAVSFDWVEWLDKKGILDPFFQPGSLTAPQRQLSGWLTNRISDHPDRVLALASSGHGQWNSVLIRNVVPEVYRLWIDRVLPSSTVLAWVMAITQRIDRIHDSLPVMLSSCQYPDDVELATHLFRFLTRPHVEMRQSCGFMEEGIQTWTDVGFNEENGAVFRSSLLEGWDTIFKSHFDTLFDVAESIVFDRLLSFYEVKAVGKDEKNAVRDAFVRRWEESNTQNRIIPDEVDVLTRAAKDLITWALEEDPLTADHLIKKWSRSGVPILETLAVFGVRRDSRLSADQKVEWVLEREWLLDRRAGGEPESLVVENYEGLTDTRRETLHETIEQTRAAFVEEDRTWALRRVRGLLENLGESDPSCELAQEACSRFEAEHADLDDDLKPVESQEETRGLRDLDPEEDLVEIMTWFEQQAEARQRRDAEDALEGILRTDATWGIRLAGALAAAEEWKTKTWFFLLRTFRRIELEDTTWNRVISSLLGFEPLHDSWPDELIHFISFQVGRQPGSIPEESVNETVQLVDTLLPKAAQVQITNGRIRRSEALGYHPYAEAVNFYYNIFVRRNEGDGIPDAFRGRVEEMVDGLPDPARQARSYALARCAARLFDLDASWTREVILPIFEWSDEKSAIAAWTGVVMPGRLSDSLIVELEGVFLDTLQRLNETGKDEQLVLAPEGQQHFIQNVADACVFNVVDPAQNGWLHAFAEAADRDQRIKWIQRILSNLRQGMHDAQIEHMWNAWLEGYWQRRNQGIPIPLDPVELKEMARWLPYMDSVYPQAVEVLLEADQEISVSTPFDVLYFVRDKGLASRYPRPTFSLVSFILYQERVVGSVGFRDIQEILPILAGEDELSADELDPLFERAIELGIIEAAFKQAHLGDGE